MAEKRKAIVSYVFTSDIELALEVVNKLPEMDASDSRKVKVETERKFRKTGWEFR